MKKSSKKILTPKAFGKKVVASLPKHTDGDLKRYIGAVSEDSGHQVSAVSEQFGGLNTKIDVLGDKLNTKIDVLTEEMGGMKEDIEVIKSNIEIIKSNLSRKVDYADFVALEKRVRLVETKLHR